ncbi:MAG: phosphoglucosamine mutase [Candidatus Marinimicrobia bacterium]|nr:phosphoglucosamine mutase [Candidatus Neomarinimicrobiota bacterium]MCF7840226.1 phosphoglucosamine mutase [Candidatus Neomarinimicrobiota bacterium]
MPTLISGISGVRGIINDGFDPDVVTRYTIAFGRMVGGGKIVIAQDTRPSGKMFKDVVESVLQSIGCDVIDCDVCPTPTAQLMVEKLDANGGIIVTASHNPIEWNALKFVGKGGLFLDAEQHAELMRFLETPVEKLEKWDVVGDLTRQHDAIRQHIEDVLALKLVDAELVKRRRPKVVVDAINGAGSKALPGFLTALGCEVIRMNCDHDGNFVHTPEPTPANLTDLMARVREEKADLGLATDPDADRLAVIDENGEPLVEEYTLVLAAYHALRHAEKADGKVLVTNLSTTMALDDLAARYGRKVLRTPVGEIHVARQMQKQPTLIGGEGNGGVILPECHLGRDSLVGAGLILTLLAETGQSMREIADELPRYQMVKDKISIGTADAKKILADLAEEYKSETPNLEDGVKITWSDRWVHFRASNTEPIIRVFAEAKDEATASQLVQDFKAIIEKLL